MIRLGMLLLCALVLLTPAHARAGDKAAAQTLFDAARKAMKAGDLEDACKKFKKSYALDPAVGTLINLARCYDKAGKTASAWVTYREVVGAAKAQNQAKRWRYAEKKAAGLEPSLAKLRIEVPEPVKGIKVYRGEEEISEELWGTAVPVDPGDYVLTAEAPGRKGWAEELTVGEEPGEIVVTVPLLKAAQKDPEQAATPPPPPPPPPEPDPDEEPPSDGMVQWVLGWVTLGLGVGGLGAGTALRFMALDRDEQSLDHCDEDDPTVCDGTGVAMRDDAITLQMASLIGWVGGGALVLTGIVLLVTTPSGDEGEESDEEAALRWSPLITPNFIGAGVSTRW